MHCSVARVLGVEMRRPSPVLGLLAGKVGGVSAKMRGIACVRPEVAVAYLVVWNVLMLIGLYLNGFRRRIDNPVALAIVAGALLVTGLMSLAVVRSSRFRRIILRPGSDPDTVRRDFGFLTALCLSMGALAAVGVAMLLL
jgi:hypothetical protein